MIKNIKNIINIIALSISSLIVIGSSTASAKVILVMNPLYVEAHVAKTKLVEKSVHESVEKSKKAGTLPAHKEIAVPAPSEVTIVTNAQDKRKKVAQQFVTMIEF